MGIPRRLWSPGFDRENVAAENQGLSAVSLLRQRVLMVVVFGALALLITAAGLYGVIGFIVSQRTPEIAIRMALGACKRDVIHFIAGYVTAPLLGGLVLGLAGAFWVGRLLPALIADGRGDDPVILAFWSVLVVLITAVAVMAQTRAATAVDPIAVLRNE